MIHEPTSTVRARRLRERRAKGVVMVAPVEVGEGGVELLRGSRQSGFGKLGDGVVERGCGHWLGEGHGPEQREARRRRRRLARRPEREDERQQTHDLSV